MPRALTQRQRHFVAAYLDHGKDAVHAYMLSYGPDLTEAQAKAGSTRCLRAAVIAEAITREQARRLQAKPETPRRQQEAQPVSKERVIAALARLAFYDARDVLEWSEAGLRVKSSESLDDDTAFAIEEVVETPRGLRVKLADKRAALVELGRALGLFREQPNRDTPQRMSRAEVEAELAALRAHQEDIE